MITGTQIREARRLLKWPVYRMAQHCKVSIKTVPKLELPERPPGIADATLVRIRATLEAAGVEFVDGEQPGVKLKVRS